MVPVPRTVTMNNGSRLWIISDEISMSRLTIPSTQTPDGMWCKGGRVATCRCISLVSTEVVPNRPALTHRVFAAEYQNLRSD